ncbi:uncharacterized protein FIBRA_02998 [Fibroporia radiculosa]|uniref:SCP domain-containing protein n=1 Tax=Fibroporia radiculosa TaxID=599839 RepID=J4I9D1_9APHY|nr:uncharacterized protein FIBRA_02998 [Fibroporia radiculosa]CCM00951.1 predicted protein [Fibroporia radiculosa]
MCSEYCTCACHIFLNTFISSVSSTAIVSSSSLSTLTSPVPATTSSSIIALTAAPTNANILVTSVPSETTALSTPVSTSALPPSTTQDEEVAATTASSNTQSQSSPTGTSSQSDIDEYLSDQNTVRAQHGATPLTWNYTLAAAAQEWADGCVFDHSGGTLENLAAGTGSSYGISAAISSWTNEVSEYDPNDPVASHFTQVVWKATTEVGCAVQECNGIFPASYGEAQYYPVYRFIQQEYTRACLITYESQPKDGVQEGWGRPDTKDAKTRYRTALVRTIRDIDELAHLVIPRHPALRPHARMLHHFRFILPLLTRDESGLTPLHYYDSAIQLARHASREPTEAEFAVGMDAANEIKRILDECKQEMLEGSVSDLLGSISTESLS